MTNDINMLVNSGPNMYAPASGENEYESGYTPAQEVKLEPDGGVSFRQNILARHTGTYTNSPWASTGVTGKYLQRW